MDLAYHTTNKTVMDVILKMLLRCLRSLHSSTYSTVNSSVCLLDWNLQRNTDVLESHLTFTKVMERPRCGERRDMLVIFNLQVHQSSMVEKVTCPSMMAAGCQLDAVIECKGLNITKY